MIKLSEGRGPGSFEQSMHVEYGIGLFNPIIPRLGFYSRMASGIMKTRSPKWLISTIKCGREATLPP